MMFIFTQQQLMSARSDIITADGHAELDVLILL